jgi:hypothetical protein
MNPQEIHGTCIPAAETEDDLRFNINDQDHDLTLQFTCGVCGQTVVCIGICLDHSRFAWYTGLHLIRYENGQYICPICWEMCC